MTGIITSFRCVTDLAFLPFLLFVLKFGFHLPGPSLPGDSNVVLFLDDIFSSLTRNHDKPKQELHWNLQVSKSSKEHGLELILLGIANDKFHRWQARTQLDPQSSSARAITWKLRGEIRK